MKRKDQYLEVILLLGGAIALAIYQRTGNLTESLVFLFIVIVLILLFFRFRREYIRQRYRNSILSDIDHMSGEQYERYLKVYFEDQGYKAKLTPTSHDYGADLILTKDGVKTVVQAKRYKGRVGIAAIQQVIGAKSYYKADKAMVCTTYYFTKQAINLARADNVELLDRDTLLKIKK